MSNNNTNNQQQQQQQQMQQLPQVFAQYQQNIDFFNNNIAAIRRNLERPDISPEEREAFKKQEQELQGKLAIHQTLINNLTPQMVAQSLQQRVLSQQQQQQQQQMGSPASTTENMSTPGSPASFNQQQLANFANAAQQQQQLRNAQQQQQAMNKMGLAAAAAAVAQQQQQQQAFSSPKPNAAAQAAVAAAAQAAAKNNNGMFTFPTNVPVTPSTSTPATPTTANPPATPTAPAPAPKPSSAPSLDIDNQNRVLTKRKIQEMVSQIDPTERLEPEVEDILLEIADEFIESVTTFACQLAKHRKSDTLEVKDVQLHLERNWNIRIPGFASDDIRPLRKPTIPSSHQTKIQAVNAAKNQLANSSHKKSANTDH